jgi:hypothetical protein
MLLPITRLIRFLQPNTLHIRSSMIHRFLFQFTLSTYASRTLAHFSWTRLDFIILPSRFRPTFKRTSLLVAHAHAGITSADSAQFLVDSLLWADLTHAHSRAHWHALLCILSTRICRTQAHSNDYLVWRVVFFCLWLQGMRIWVICRIIDMNRCNCHRNRS